MPKYEITLSNGRRMQVEADKPPSEADVMAYLSKNPTSPSPQPSTAQPTAVMVGGKPMSFEDFNSTQQQKPRTWEESLKEVGAGAEKGLQSTIFGLGKIVHDYTPVGRLSESIRPGAFDQRPPQLEPTNTPQKIGFGAEQVGEFFIPAGTATKAGKVVNAVKDAALSYAQTGSPVQAGISGGLTAVIPGASAVKRASSALEVSAEKTMAQALGATKEWAKVEAAKLAPQMLERGVGGSRPAMLELAKATAAKVGAQLDDAYKLAAAAGDTVPSQIIQGNVQLAADALKVPDASGILRVIPGHETAVKTLEDLGAFAASLGDRIPVDKAAQVKRAWDQIVSKAGLFGPKATSSANDNATAWAIREASGSFRDLLNQNADIAALNAEASFWTGLKKVLSATEKRTQAQSGGLVRAGMGGSGAIVGALSGDSTSERATNAVIGGIAGRQLVALMQSPAWRTRIVGPAKQTIADALASGSDGQVLSAVNRLIAALPAQLRPAATQ